MRVRKGIVPWLYYSHKSFFVAIVFEATALIWIAIEVFFGGHAEQWKSPSLQYVNSAASPFGWGVMAGIIGILLLASLYRTDFRMTRVMLTVGFWYILLNFCLLAQARWAGLPVGSALQVRWALLGNLLVQVAFEPPENPASK